MTEYLANGGDGYSIIAENKERHLQGPLDTDILKEYIKAKSPLNNQVEERIFVKTTHSENVHSTSCKNTPIVTYTSILLCFVFFAQFCQIISKHCKTIRSPQYYLVS